MTPGEESDDEAEEDNSSNRDEGGSETGGNEEEVVIISFPTARKRAYSVCLYVSSPVKDSKNIILREAHQKSHLPRPTIPSAVGTMYSNFTYNHPWNQPVTVQHSPSQPLKPRQHNHASRIPRPINPSFYLRHANFFST